MRIYGNLRTIATFERLLTALLDLNGHNPEFVKKDPKLFPGQEEFRSPAHTNKLRVGTVWFSFSYDERRRVGVGRIEVPQSIEGLVKELEKEVDRRGQCTGESE